MLRTNLSTKPFYNERLVLGVLAVLVAIVVALAIFNASRLIVLSQRQSELSRQADAADARAQQLRAHAIQVRQSVNTKQLEAMSGAAREANAIIGQRLFSWTELLNRLESTLPDNVRITALRPRVERDGTVTVIMTVTGTSTEQVEMFMANLDATTAFTEVFASEDRQTEEGEIHATIEGKYASAP